jgi:large subunit ribosomal protein L30
MSKKETKNLKITQVRSIINRPENQKRTIKALGLRRIRHSVVHNATPQILGMVQKVRHLVNVEEVK